MYTPGTLLMWSAFLLGVASTVGYALQISGQSRFRDFARQSYVLMTAGVVAASGLLMYLLVTHDYRLHYVWAYTDNLLDTKYLVSSFWGGQEGSFLLWILFGTLIGLPLMKFARAYESRVMLVYNLTLLSLLVLLLKQDPFRFHQGLESAAQIPLDGQGLNPLLQNPWMVIHPPVMFIGYASLAVPFAFAIAALWMQRYDEWVKVSMPWVLVSLVTLGTAIMLGGYWAYETLGWGGYWGWDPVENASLVPWLFTGALTHGMLLQLGRHRFRRLNLFLAVISYLFVVYATFLTRSGVLGDFSVHSFVELGISSWLVFNMAFFLCLGLGMLIWRWRSIPTEVGDEPFFSRTIFFVVGIVLLMGLGVMVAIGTSAPLLSRLWGEPAQVGPEFYNRMGFWLAVVFAVFLGGTPFLGWVRAHDNALRRLAVVLGATAALLGIGMALGLTGFKALAYVAAALFCVVSNSWALGEKLVRRRWVAAGGVTAHVGIGLMMLAFLTTGWLGDEHKVRLHQGQPEEVLGYTMTFRGVEKPTPTARDAMVVEVTSPSGASYVMKPRMWVNQKSNQMVANPDIRSFLTQDLYLAPVEYQPPAQAPVSARLLLTRGEPQSFRDWEIIFRGFDLSRQNAVPGAMTVGVVLEIERPGVEPATVQPTMLSTNDGLQAVPVGIPGVTGAQVRATGMSVDQGLVRVELMGLGGGVAQTAMLGQDEAMTYEGMRITFTGFDLADFDPAANRMDFGATFSVEHAGEVHDLVTRYSGGGRQPEITPAVIPGSGGIALDLGRVEPRNGTVEVRLYDPTLPSPPPAAATLVLDVSTKPLIGLVWLGTVLVMVGIFMAIALRRRDVDSVPAEA